MNLASQPQNRLTSCDSLPPSVTPANARSLPPSLISRLTPTTSRKPKRCPPHQPKLKLPSKLQPYSLHGSPLFTPTNTHNGNPMGSSHALRAARLKELPRPRRLRADGNRYQHQAARLEAQGIANNGIRITVYGTVFAEYGVLQ